MIYYSLFSRHVNVLAEVHWQIDGVENATRHTKSPEPFSSLWWME